MLCLAGTGRDLSHNPMSAPARDHRVKVKDLFWLLVLGGSSLFAYDKFKADQPDPVQAQIAAPATTQLTEPLPAEDRSWIKQRTSEPVSTQQGGFKCDGRTHCSQMNSCAEAEFFLKNCPNTQMDGNGDGEPCEQQWCN